MKKTDRMALIAAKAVLAPLGCEISLSTTGRHHRINVAWPGGRHRFICLSGTPKNPDVIPGVVRQAAQRLVRECQQKSAPAV